MSLFLLASPQHLSACYCFNLSQWNACATFNILNQEDRNVAAALIPFEKPHQQQK